MIKAILRRLFCKHEFVGTNEGWSVFGADHVTLVCTKCGKRKY